MQKNIIQSLVSDNSRSGRLKKNVAASFFIKGWAGVVQLLLVPVTLLCLGTYNNGLWMIVVSLLLWIDNMDLGMGNGLRNIHLVALLLLTVWHSCKNFKINI